MKSIIETVQRTAIENGVESEAKKLFKPFELKNGTKAYMCSVCGGGTLGDKFNDKFAKQHYSRLHKVEKAEAIKVIEANLNAKVIPALREVLEFQKEEGI